MPEFIKFQTALQSQLDKMSESELLSTDTDKDQLWNAYLGSFRPEDNPIYREMTVHDCQCCKQFIRAVGGVVAYVDGELETIWNITVDPMYQPVVDALDDLVRSNQITGPFTYEQRKVGTAQNHQQLESGEVKVWWHFHYTLHAKFVKADSGPYKSQILGNYDVLKRGLEELTLEAICTVHDLCEDNSLYRGAEYLLAVKGFLSAAQAYQATLKQEAFLWEYAFKPIGQNRFRNTAIGTLVVDLSEGMELEAAVRKFEAMVAPQNYKRSSSLITTAMKDKAAKRVAELGIENSLQRRFAHADDITINNVKYADRSVQRALGVLDVLDDVVVQKVAPNAEARQVCIEDFLQNIMPKCDRMEMYLDNGLSGNLVSLVAPADASAPNILKWDNNFSWSYKGEVTDSMRERVKKAGGNINGDLRFSIEWNHNSDNQDDLDAHCQQPFGLKTIYFGNANQIHASSGMLDVDITEPGRKIAVENIVFSDKRKMPAGDYAFLVHNYAHRDGASGFKAEIEFDGKIHSYEHPRSLRQGQKVEVATVTVDKDKKFQLTSVLPSAQSSRTEWGIATQKFHRVTMVMDSPNHWDGQTKGNKHWFFMLEGCNNPEQARGFYNEFLSAELHDDRKVFEVLGSKLKTPLAYNQLSGLGFSSTQRNSVMCRVSGEVNGIFKVNF